jgi:MFS family permease
VLAVFYLIGASLVLFFLGTLDGADSFTLIVVATVGFFVHASMISLYAIVPTLYPSEIRATGTGWALGLSRFGAIFGPWLTGQLLAADWAPKAIYPVFGIPTLIAALLVGLLAFKTRSNGKSERKS